MIEIVGVKFFEIWMKIYLHFDGHVIYHETITLLL